MEEDIRWKQRFQNYKKALATLTSAVELSKTRDLSDLEKQGVIQGFEFIFELAWNVMKDFLEYKGLNSMYGSKDAIRKAFNNGIINDGQVWMDMLNDRNLASHSYDEELAEKIYKNIISNYYAELIIFREKMESLEESCNTDSPTEQ